MIAGRRRPAEEGRHRSKRVIEMCPTCKRTNNKSRNICPTCRRVIEVETFDDEEESKQSTSL